MRLHSLLKRMAALLLFAALAPAPAFSLDSEDSKLFISGFSAYQRNEYPAAIEGLTAVLKNHPDTPLKDVALFWLARAQYKAGHSQQAGKLMAQFLRDYPQSPLKGTVEEELLQLARGGAAAETMPQKPEPAADPAPLGASAATVATVASVATVATVVPEQGAVEAPQSIAAIKETVPAKAAAEMAPVEKTAAGNESAGKAAAGNVTAAGAATVQASADRAPAEKVAAERAATERAAAARKALADKEAAEAAAAKAAEKSATGKAGRKRTEELRKKERALAAAEAARNKSIASYKEVIDRFPGTAAAAGASVKLREMGIQYPVVRQRAVAPQQGEVTQAFDLEVAQYADLEVTLGPAPRTLEAGKPFAIAFDVVNTGNGNDSFRFESGFPAEYDFHFAAASAPEKPVTGTPPLAVGEKFPVVAVGTVPRGNVDGQKNSFPIRIVSVLEREVSQSRELALVTSAPMLRTVLKPDKAKLLPGERVSYRISLLNDGSAPARSLTLRLSYPPQYEALEFPAAGFAQGADGSLVMEGMQLKPGEGKDISLTFRVRDEALAEQELFLRAEITNHDLKKRETAVSATSVVQRVSSVTARSQKEKLIVVPGQALSVPITVTNNGNIREAFSVKAAVEGAGSYSVFADLNRDGKKGANEPAVNQVGPLSPREEAQLLLHIETPPTAGDGSAAHAAVSFLPEDPLGRSARVNLQLAYSRPILELAMAAQRGKLKPGEVSSLELNCVNRGSNLAKQVTVQSILPAQLELVAADPAFFQAENGIYTWRFDEMGAGEKRNIRMTYRVRPGIAMGTSMQVKNLLNYHDPLGNRY